MTLPLGEVTIGGVLEVLASWPAASVHCVVTSPPYWGLRAYQGEQACVWGGAAECKHTWAEETLTVPCGTGGNWTQAENGPGLTSGRHQTRFRGDVNAAVETDSREISRSICSLCGAWRGGLGLEPCHDCGRPTGELCSVCYVCHTLTVLRAIRRVLRPDGVVFWNLGDGYAGTGGAHANDVNPGLSKSFQREGLPQSRNSLAPPGLKRKDLMMIPFRVALAAQADGWWVRSVVIWDKPNCMPEPTRDRPTTSHEYILLLTKSERYFYDADAISEPAIRAGQIISFNGTQINTGHENRRYPGATGPRDIITAARRNIRTVWRIPTRAYLGAHFAVFPPELPQRCILAGCPPRVCAKCGTPWARVLDKQTHFESGSGAAGRTAEEANATGKWAGIQHGENIKLGPVVRTRTTGFRPTCSCGVSEWLPGIVLDPFAGSGTTLKVAQDLGRRWAGIEICEEYAELCRQRLGRVTELPEPEGDNLVLPMGPAS